MGNILVTGAAGFIGSHVVNQLLESNSKYEVIGLDNFFLGNSDNLKKARGYERFHFVRGDATSISTLSDVISTFEVQDIFALATVPLPTSLQFPKWSTDQNMLLASTVLELVRSNRVERLVQVSSSEVYGDGLDDSMTEQHPLKPYTPYAVSKAGADMLALSYKRVFESRILIVRPFNNYGPNQNSAEYSGFIPRLISAALSGSKLEIFGNGQQTRDWVYVKDTARAIVSLSETAAAWKQDVVNIASNISCSTLDVVRIFQPFLPELNLTYLEPRNGDVLYHKGNNDLMKKILGWVPGAFDNEKVDETVKYYASKFNLAY